MSDAEFDNLKDELVWEGSKVAVLRRVPPARGWRAHRSRSLRVCTHVPRKAVRGGSGSRATIRQQPGRGCDWGWRAGCRLKGAE